MEIVQIVDGPIVLAIASILLVRAIVLIAATEGISAGKREYKTRIVFDSGWALFSMAIAFIVPSFSFLFGIEIAFSENGVEYYFDFFHASRPLLGLISFIAFIILFNGAANNYYLNNAGYLIIDRSAGYILVRGGNNPVWFGHKKIQIEDIEAVREGQESQSSSSSHPHLYFIIITGKFGAVRIDFTSIVSRELARHTLSI